MSDSRIARELARHLADHLNHVSPGHRLTGSMLTAIAEGVMTYCGAIVFGAVDQDAPEHDSVLSGFDLAELECALTTLAEIAGHVGRAGLDPDDVLSQAQWAVIDKAYTARQARLDADDNDNKEMPA